MSPRSNLDDGVSDTPTISLDERQEVLSVEKGFWRVRHGAQELLRFCDIYRKSRAKHQPPEADVLPAQIDLVAMTQLSWGVLQAVGGIKTHQRRVEELDALWRKDRTNSIRCSRSSSKEPAATAACSRCSRLNSPRWRRGPDGARTLCNVCGLIYAKRSRRVKATKPVRTGSICPQSIEGHTRDSFQPVDLTVPA